MRYNISGIQQIGIGVRDVADAWDYYRSAFGMDVPVFQDEAEAPLMVDYTGAESQRRHAVLAYNLSGGAGFEIWQFTSRRPQPPSFYVQFGDLGLCCAKIKSCDIGAAYDRLSGSGADMLGDPQPAPDGTTHFYMRDPFENIFEIVEADTWFGKPSIAGGVGGAIIGTTSIDEAMKLYSDVLGYDEVVYDVSGIFSDMTEVPGGDRELRRVLLRHTSERTGPFSELLGPTTIELLELTSGRGRKIFQDRQWGDLGFIHLCFDVRGMDSLALKCTQIGRPFTVDSGDTFDMGEAGGRFSYAEDPGGALIEFVETHKLQLVKSLGIKLDLSKRSPEKRLPRWLIKMLGLARVK